MSSLNELINAQTDQQLREDLLDRLAIVEHKIKFMDKVPVCFLDSEGEMNLNLGELAVLSGAVLTTLPREAVYVIFAEENKMVDEMMASVPTLLDGEWPSVKYSRICLLSDSYNLSDAHDAVALVEAIAEMIHPGLFIFGDEGSKWIRFSI
jgi:hypothetical protein